ncbi:MAG TPA: tyrosine-type recombinase/integrase [Burkholderiales bacterium]|nr:tyrosine-type recombinase/integrase [Burkholderiales bacterium]
MTSVVELLDAPENAQRAALLAAGDRLAATLRGAEARVWRPLTWLAEVWRWTLWLRITRGLSMLTVAHYVRTLTAFAAWVDSRLLDFAELTLRDLDAWQQHLWMARRNVVGVRATALYAVRSFYDWRELRGFGRNCTSGMRAPKLAKRIPRKYTKSQLRKLFEAAKTASLPLTAMRNKTMLMLLYATGMRREEVANLRIDQLEIEEKIAVVRVFGKGAKEREVPIEGPAVRLLQEWLAERAKWTDVETDAVFFTTRRNWWGRKMSTHAVECAVKAIAKRAGLGEWGVHRFRVTFATQLYDDGVDLEKIRILLGHENIETTRNYISVSSSMRRVRLKSHRQHEVLGTFPEGLPLWARQLEAKKST